MTIYYEDETATIYQGNMEEIIRTLEFDYIITDPPYNKGYKYPDYKDRLKENDYINLLKNMNGYKTALIHYPESICNVVNKALGDVNKMISWCYNSNMSYRAHRTIAFYNCMPDFNKVKQPYKKPKDKAVLKLIANGSTGAKSYDWFESQIVKNTSKEKNSNFTNQIPIVVLERIIKLISKEGDTILDPFFGSGSLYFACKKLNRKCIGIEQSEKHLDIFKERLNQFNIGD
tara:strand:- start:2765 stop:3457 length:693 start_codon:yes stop_codon:yes gene_type:complete